MCLYKGNLPPEYELMHQFTVYQVGKRNKLCQTTYHSQHPILTRYCQMCPYKGNLPPEYELMHQFTVYQVGKGTKYYHSQHPIQTRYSQMCPNKDNLPPEHELMHQFTVYQVGKRNEILSLTTPNPDKVQSNVSEQRQLTS